MIPKEGHDPTVIIARLDDTIRQFQGIAGSWGTGPDAWELGQNAYLQVVETLDHWLWSFFEDDDGAGAGLHGEGYKMIREMTAWTPRPSPLITGEIERQVRVLRALQAELVQLRALQQRPGRPVIFDTNALMHYQRLDSIPWAEVLNIGQVRIILPICVIDELDNKKYTGADRMSRRADLALRALREYSNDLRPGSAAMFEDGTTLEILLDGPAHQRKINPDEELLSRSTLVQRMIGRPVIIVTGDFGMQLRIDARGLEHGEMPGKYAKDAKRREQAETAEVASAAEDGV